eukprot:TCONS_00043590-protein
MNAVVLDDKEGYYEHRRSFAIDLIKSVVTNITKESIDLVFPRNKTPSGKIKKMTQLNTQGRKSPHSIIEEESEDPQDVSFFNEVGLDHSTAESLANKKLTKTKFFTRDFHGKKASYMITPEFRKIPIICDRKTLKRRRGGNWVDITLKLIKEANPFCSWKFTYNHIRKNKTNKKNSSYWVAKAKCTFVDCNCRVEITQEDKESLELVFHFIGDINHNVTKPKSRKINGEARKQVKSKFLKEPNHSAAGNYRKSLASIPSDVFASGNRDRVGTSKKVHQKIRSEVNIELNGINNLHKNLCDLQRRLAEDDKSMSQKLDLKFRKIFGFIQRFIVTDTEFKLVMFEEKHVRLYHNTAKRDIIYLDATGGIVKKIKAFKKIFMYALTMRHPFGKTVALPALSYLTSSHSMESVRFSLMALRENERQVFGECSQPKLVILDNSKVLQGAILREFNNESITDYVNRVFDTLTLSSSQRSTLTKILTDIFSCSGHLLKQVKRAVSKKCATIKDFILFSIGRMIVCEKLEELTTIITLFSSILTTRFSSDGLRDAVKMMENYINQFDGHDLVEDVLSDQNDKDDELESEEDDDDDEEEDVEKDHGEVEEKDGNEKKTKANAKTEKTKTKKKKKENKWTTYWTDQIDKSRRKYEWVGEDINEAPINEYYSPTFFEYFKKNLLNITPIWTRIWISERNPDTLKGRSTKDQNSTNATVENFFKYVKSEHDTSLPIVSFVKKYHESLNNLSVEFLEGIVQGCGNVGEKEEKIIRIFRDEVEDNPVSIDTEKWSKRRKRKPGNKYLRPKKKAKLITSTQKGKAESDEMSDTDDENEEIEEERNEIGNNNEDDEIELEEEVKKEKWFETRELKTARKSWHDFTEKEKEMMNESGQQGCCSSDIRGVNMVACEFCEKWFHECCLNFDFQFLQLVDYICYDCFKSNTTGIANFFFYHFKKNPDLDQHGCEMHWNTLSEEHKKSFGDHIFLTKKLLITDKIIVQSKIGIVNKKLNCWFSSVLHSLFGSSASCLFGSSNQSLLRIQEMLRTQPTAKVPAINLMREYKAMSDDLGIDVNSNRNQDPSDLAFAIIRRLPLALDFKIRALVIHNCSKCQQILKIDSRTEEESLDLTVPANYQHSIKLTDLVWYNLGGWKSYDHDDILERCLCKSNEISTFVTLLDSPIYIVLKFSRIKYVNKQVHLAKTKILLEHEIDLGEFSPAFQTDSKYLLVSSVNYAGGQDSVFSNHFTATLFDHEKGKAVWFDDNTVKRFTTEKWLKNESFQKSVFYAIYIKKSSIGENKSFDYPWNLDEEKIFLTEKVMFGDLTPSNITPTSSLLSCSGKNLVTGDIIFTFVKAVASNYPSVKVVSSDVITNARSCSQNVEFQVLQSEGISLCNLVIIIHHTPPGHWSIIGIYPKQKMIFHLNSIATKSEEPFQVALYIVEKVYETQREHFFFAQWQLYQPVKVPQQKDTVNCGVFACLNAYNLIERTTFSGLEDDPACMRYWIASTCLNAEIHLPERTNFKTKSIDPPEKFDHLIIDRHLKTCRSPNIFDKIFETVETYVLSDDSDKNSSSSSNEVQYEEEVKLPYELDQYLESGAYKAQLEEVFRTPLNVNQYDIVVFYSVSSRSQIKEAFSQVDFNYVMSFKMRCEIGLILMRKMNGTSFGIPMRHTTADFYLEIVCPVLLCLFYKGTKKINLLEAERLVAPGYPYHVLLLSQVFKLS